MSLSICHRREERIVEKGKDRELVVVVIEFLSQNPEKNKRMSEVLNLFDSNG